MDASAPQCDAFLKHGLKWVIDGWCNGVLPPLEEASTITSFSCEQIK